ncbi:MAG TPA: right-handed parallel beta-helix repeat-containing protein [Candidatus Thermoplasmatota archaeon]|nr:right-handed parallel beta-helix repeat-containing protein [Candidatus Thermoplasmatota archaeon]
MGGNHNKKHAVLFLCGILFFSIISSSLPISAEQHAKTIIVDKDGSGDYTTITAAVDAAQPGDTIFVHDGVYEETEILIDKTITLTGETISSTIISGDETKTILIIQADNVVISTLTISEGGDWGGENIAVFANYIVLSDTVIEQGNGTGISIHNSTGSIIENNVFTSNQEGIICYNCRETTISNNQVSDSIAGIYLYNSIDMLVEKNSVSTCNKGIYLEESNDNLIQLNDLSRNDQGAFISYSANNLITENNFISNREHAKFTTWLSPTGLQISKWNANYWDDAIAFLPKWIPGVLFIRTYNPIGIFLPWFSIDWHPAAEPYDIDGGNII